MEKVIEWDPRHSAIYPPDYAGKIVGMTSYKGDVIVACEYAVFRIVGTELVPIRFSES